MKRIVVFSFTILILIACFLYVTTYHYPITPEAYLQQFDSFLLKAQKKEQQGSGSWHKEDKRFKNLPKNFYQRFEKQLSLSNKLLVRRFELEYLLIRGKYEGEALLNGFGGFLKRDITARVDFIWREIVDITNLAKELCQVLKTAKVKDSIPLP